jgi:hypothetical protein
MFQIDYKLSLPHPRNYFGVSISYANNIGEILYLRLKVRRMPLASMYMIIS